MAAVELGCGTGYVSSWMARRGARSVYGIDIAAKQLETARRLAAAHSDVSSAIVFDGAYRVVHRDWATSLEDVPWQL
jgi:2-polyprenyl-3-methyl-5-hydroxy-6-metoxy-1,4-benzoquinol methylase